MPTGHIVKVSPELIRPPHAVRDFIRLRKLYRSLRAGWKGRPLLGYAVRDARVAVVSLTGTHRLAAAKLAQHRAVPVRLIQTERYPREWRFAADGVYLGGVKIVDQEVLYQAFRAYGMKREAELLRVDLLPVRVRRKA